MTGAEFIRVWAAWDAHPTFEHEASQMVAADVELGARLGMSHMVLRDQLAAARRNGLSYEQALTRVQS